MLDRNGDRACLKALLQVPGSVLAIRGSCKGDVPDLCKNFGNFSQNRGKNIVKVIVGRIPSGRGYQLMPLFKAGKGRFWGYFSGFGQKLSWVNELCFA